jgi:hypothetical protein
MAARGVHVSSRRGVLRPVVGEPPLALDYEGYARGHDKGQ